MARYMQGAQKTKVYPVTQADMRALQIRQTYRVHEQ